MSQTLQFISEFTVSLLSTIYEKVYEISESTSNYLSSILYDDEDINFIHYLQPSGYIAGPEPSSEEIRAVIEEAKRDIKNDVKERELKVRYEALMKEYLIEHEVDEGDFSKVDNDDDDENNGATRLLVAS